MIEFQGFPKIPRYSRDCIITEKIDGTNAQIYILETDIPGSISNIQDAIAYYTEKKLLLFAGSRTRYITPENDNYGFAKWVKENSNELFRLGPGRHFGEWWGQGIQRGYELKEKRFSLFNTIKWGDDLVRPSRCYITPIIYSGVFCTSAIEMCLEILKRSGSYAAPGFMNPEGIVIYHVAGNLLFKKTIKNDDEPKSKI